MSGPTKCSSRARAAELRHIILLQCRRMYECYEYVLLTVAVVVFLSDAEHQHIIDRFWSLLLLLRWIWQKLKTRMGHILNYQGTLVLLYSSSYQ